ncbi:MAG: PfkB family carbohydrate kinase [Geminicoccaceae bacterium]
MYIVGIVLAVMAALFVLFHAYFRKLPHWVSIAWTLATLLFMVVALPIYLLIYGLEAKQQESKGRRKSTPAAGRPRAERRGPTLDTKLQSAIKSWEIPKAIKRWSTWSPRQARLSPVPSNLHNANGADRTDHTDLAVIEEPPARPLPRDETNMADIVCFGDLLIDFVPTISGLAFADLPSFKPAPGGAAANVAVGFARLGGKSAFMGKVGDEAFGHLLVDTLKREGVDVGPVRIDKNARTALAFVTLAKDGERDFLFYRHPSADMLFTPAEVDQKAIHDARIFHFDSISLAAEQPRKTALFAAGKAASAGKLISYDVNLRLPLWNNEAEARDGIMEGMAHAAIVKLSDDELAFMVGDMSPNAIRSKLWHDGLKLVVLSLGRRGCIAMTERGEQEVPSIAVNAVDTTGAGDGFVAGLLSGIADNPDVLGDDQAIGKLCRFANAVGALTATARGAIPSLPTRDQVEMSLANV